MVECAPNDQDVHVDHIRLVESSTGRVRRKNTRRLDTLTFSLTHPRSGGKADHSQLEAVYAESMCCLVCVLDPRCESTRPPQAVHGLENKDEDMVDMPCLVTQALRYLQRAEAESHLQHWSVSGVSGPTELLTRRLCRHLERQRPKLKYRRDPIEGWPCV